MAEIKNGNNVMKIIITIFCVVVAGWIVYFTTGTRTEMSSKCEAMGIRVGKVEVEAATNKTEINNIKESLKELRESQKKEFDKISLKLDKIIERGRK